MLVVINCTGRDLCLQIKNTNGYDLCHHSGHTPDTVDIVIEIRVC